jgi:branched-chain amino acid transport system permease protein
LIDLLLNVIVDGILLGGFYTLISMGLAISFGLLKISNVAHATFIVAGGYSAYILSTMFGIDPIIAGAISLPLYFFVGFILYLLYSRTIEERGYETGLMSLVFWFGFLIVVEVFLLIVFGSDYKSFYSEYMTTSISFLIFKIPMRLLIPFSIALVVDVILYYIFSRTLFGLGVRAIAQNKSSAMLMGYNPTRVNMWAFGISIAIAAFGGSLLLMMQPIQPFMDRQFIGRTFAVVVLGGMGSLYGTVISSVILGITEAIVSAFFGASWSICISFAILLLSLIVRPEGLFRR